MIGLRRMTPQDQPALASVLPDYITEVAPGLEKDPHAIAAWHILQDGRASYWIMDRTHPVGFALSFRHPDDLYELAEFYIHPRRRRVGLGQTAARRLFDLFPGEWTFGVSANPPQAALFWDTCLHRMPGLENLSKGPPRTKWQSHSYHFTIIGDDT